MHLHLTTKQTARNRPVLIHQNNETITMRNAEILGFKSKYLYLTFVYAYLYNIYIYIYNFFYCFTCSGILLYASKVYINASQIEDRLQRKLNHLPLGHRLWRHVAKGGYSDIQKYEGDNLFKVFLTYAPVRVLEELQVQHWIVADQLNNSKVLFFQKRKQMSFFFVFCKYLNHILVTFIITFYIVNI